MTRATYAKVLIRLGGGLPSAAWSEAKVTALLAPADYIIDSYTSPITISTTDNNAVEIAVDVVLRMMRQADMLQESSGTDAHDGRTYSEIVLLTDELKQRIDGLVRASNFGVFTVDLVGGE
jgi:hypothetical protein